MKNQLCRIALSGLLATGLTLGSAAAFAQQDTPAPDASAQQPGNGGGQWAVNRMTPDEQVARMTKRYNLSADQQTQIKPILADAQQQMMALRAGQFHVPGRQDGQDEEHSRGFEHQDPGDLER